MTIISTNPDQLQHNAACKIQEWWRNLYESSSSDTSSDTSSSSDTTSDTTSDASSEVFSDIYPNGNYYINEIPKYDYPQQKNFCDNFVRIFVKVSFIILLPITYFRVKYYFY